MASTKATKSASATSSVGATAPGRGQITTGSSARHAGQEDRIGVLVGELTSDVSRLVRDELELAKVELKGKGKQAGIGIGLFGGAGTFGLYGLGALVAAAILGLAEALPAWLSALLVGVALLIVAGIAALLGKGRLARATPPVPRRVVAGLQEDLEALKGHHLNRRGRA